MKPYSQTTDYTCASSALLMALNHYNPSIKLSTENEYDIWLNTVVLPTRASSIFGLAVYAKEKGLNPQIVTEEISYVYPDYRFKRYKKTDIEKAKEIAKIYLKKAQQLNIPIQERSFTLDFVKQLLKKKKKILLRVNAGVLRDTKSTSNFIMINDFKNNQFNIFDPAQGELNVSEEKMQEAFDTLVTKNKRQHRMIIL